MFSRAKKAAITTYRSFLADGAKEERRPEFHGEGTLDNRVFGDDLFVEGILGTQENESQQISVDDVLAAVCSTYSLESSLLALPGKNRAIAHARGMAAWIIQDLPSCTMTQLAKYLGRDISSLSAAAARLLERSLSEVPLLEEKEAILSQIPKCKA